MPSRFTIPISAPTSADIFQSHFMFGTILKDCFYWKLPDRKDDKVMTQIHACDDVSTCHICQPADLPHHGSRMVFASWCHQVSEWKLMKKSYAATRVSMRKIYSLCWSRTVLWFTNVRNTSVQFQNGMFWGCKWSAKLHNVRLICNMMW